MQFQKGFSEVFVILLVVVSFVVLAFVFTGPNTNSPNVAGMPSPTPSPTPMFPYSPPTIPKNQSYRIVLVGDSMTRALGVNANALRLALIDLYPENEFVTYNYGDPSTNILTLPDRLTEPVTIDGSGLPPVLAQGFELIIIESFAYNPPSELTLEEGVSRHHKVLDEVISKIIAEKPNVYIALMATIAPSEIDFAVGSRDLSPEVRKQWVDERVSYIKTHIEYAHKNNIPLIDVYEKSLLDGMANPVYINEDNIHPSDEGVELIAQTIAEFIYENEVFPY